MRISKAFASTASFAIASALVASLLAACAGSSNDLTPISAQRDGSQLDSARRRVVRVKMRIVIRSVPRRGRFAHRILHGNRRNPFYTASTTQGIDVKVSQGTSGVLAETQTNISAGGSNCTTNGDASRTCTFPVPAPPGTDTFTFTTYDGPPVSGGGFGTANQLGYSQLTQPIVAGSANNFPSISLSGVVSALSVNAPIAQIHGTLPSVQALGVFALDADGNVILDSQYYDANANPISIALSLGTPTGPGGGTFKLSATSFLSPPGAAVQLSYDGKAMLPSGANSGAFSTTVVAKAAGATTVIAAAKATVSLIGPSIQAFKTPNKSPQELVLGPDGNVWFTDSLGNTVDSMAPDGTITAHAIPTAESEPKGIAVGPDGNIWFVEQGGSDHGNIGWVTPGTTGAARECPSTKANPGPLSAAGPVEIVSQPPNMYVIEAIPGAVAKMTTGCALLDTFPIFKSGAGPDPQGIAVAPNGNIWYTELETNRIGAMTPNGTSVLGTSVPNTPVVCTGDTAKILFVDQIAFDPSGDAWFTEECSAVVGRVTSSGSFTMTSLGTPEGAHGIVYGPDGNLWVGIYASGFGRISNGGFVNYGLGTTLGDAYAVIVGADSDLWFTDMSGHIGRFVW